MKIFRLPFSFIPVHESRFGVQVGSADRQVGKVRRLPIHPSPFLIRGSVSLCDTKPAASTHERVSRVLNPTLKVVRN